MNDDERPDDSALTAELVDSLADLAVPERPPLAAITDRGRVYQRRRLAGLAGLGVACAVTGIALVLGLTGVLGAAPTRNGTAQTAAFTLTSYTNGTVSLKLSQVFDPAALQRALAQHGTRALVKVGSYCSSSPAAPSSIRLGVLPGASPGPAGTRRRAAPGLGNGQGIWESVTLPVKPSQLAPMVDPISMVINPAAMPAGTELFIGYFDLAQTIVVNLIYTSSHTCRNTQQPPGGPP
ncbi:MAG: hypothetical protein ABR926_12525 [Streptosporangiaceae bacterium]|jgi:hypothetical protein